MKKLHAKGTKDIRILFEIGSCCNWNACQIYRKENGSDVYLFFRDGKLKYSFDEDTFDEVPNPEKYMELYPHRTCEINIYQGE